MNKIIRGSRYNTETARSVAYIEPNGTDKTKSNYYSETLYCSRSGKYFIYGNGTPNSKYGKWVGNTGNWGEEIRPYTPEEAKEWAETYMTRDSYEVEFGEVEFDEAERAPLSLTISAEMKKKLELLRQKENKSISQIVEEMLEDIIK